MKHFLIFLSFCSLWVGRVSAQSYWRKTNFTTQRGTHSTDPSFQYFTLDKAAFARVLQASETSRSAVIVTIPNAEGKLINYYITPTQVLSEAVARKFPSIKTFVGKGVDDATEHIRFTWSDYGLDAIMQKNLHYSFVEAEDQEGVHYRVYKHEDTERPLVDCKTLDVPALVAESQALQRATFSSANVHRTFRIAIACTYSFTTYFNGKAAAFAQIVNILNKVNEVYGQQLSIAFSWSQTIASFLIIKIQTLLRILNTNIGNIDLMYYNKYLMIK